MSVVENIQNVESKNCGSRRKKRQNGGGRTSVGSQQDKACGADWRARCRRESSSLGENKVQEIMEKYEPMMEYAPERESLAFNRAFADKQGEIYH